MMPATTSITSPHCEHVLAAHTWQERSNDCGPYSAAFVINALTPTPVEPARLARELDRLAWHGLLPVIRRIPNWATFPWGVADVLRRNGVPARWKPLATPAELIRALLNGDLPLLFVGGWRPLWGHVMVLLAWDPERGWGFADPASQEHGLHWIDDRRLQRIWWTYARCMVIARGKTPA